MILMSLFCEKVILCYYLETGTGTRGIGHLETVVCLKKSLEEMRYWANYGVEKEMQGV